MTDQMIPADLHPEDVEHAHSYVQDYLDATYAPDRTLAVARVLQALLPPPPLPTLADIPPEERSASRWLQCDHGIPGRSRSRGVIGYFDYEDEKAVILTTTCGVQRRDYAHVTPRPDLPRLEWPGDAPTPAPALPEGWRLADHRAYGRVVVTNTVPDADGHVYFVAPAPEPLGNDWHPCDPAELTYLDTADPAPPSTLTVGSEWDDADALNRACEESGRDQIVVSDQDGYAFVWDKAAEWWEGSMPPQFIPLTILHTGKKADQ